MKVISFTISDRKNADEISLIAWIIIITTISVLWATKLIHSKIQRKGGF